MLGSTTTGAKSQDCLGSGKFLTMGLCSSGLSLRSTEHWKGAAPAGCTEIILQECPTGQGCEDGGFRSFQAKPGLPLRAGQPCSHAGKEKCCPHDLTWCFISLVIDDLIRKRRQKFLCYGLWGGLGMKEFCCFGSCCHGFCQQVGARGILMQKKSDPLGLGVNWLMILRNEVLNLAHKNSSCVGPCHWLPLRINPFLRTLTLGFCWCWVLVCKYSFTKSHSCALCPQCLPAALTVLMGWQWGTQKVSSVRPELQWLEMC